jgi:hypothetical protein
MFTASCFLHIPAMSAKACTTQHHQAHHTPDSAAPVSHAGPPRFLLKAETSKWAQVGERKTGRGS